MFPFSSWHISSDLPISVWVVEPCVSGSGMEVQWRSADCTSRLGTTATSSHNFPRSVMFITCRVKHRWYHAMRQWRGMYLKKNFCPRTFLTWRKRSPISPMFDIPSHVLTSDFTSILRWRMAVSHKSLFLKDEWSAELKSYYSPLLNRLPSWRLREFTRNLLSLFDGNELLLLPEISSDRELLSKIF